MDRRRQQWVVIASVFLLIAATGALSDVRTTILKAAGRALIVDDSVEPADVIVVAIDADGAGVLEAADLVHRGIAERVAVFSDPPDAVNREFVRRGGWYEDDAARSVRQLRSLGVETVERIPTAVAGTEDEGSVLPAWCVRQRCRSIVVVTSADHSRRLRRVLHRAMKGQSTRVMIRSARNSQFHPDRWWNRRAGIRTEVLELQKLLLDIVRHPIS
jgi:hypothetical protein